MKIIVIIGALLLLQTSTTASLLDPVIENVRHIKATHPPEAVSGMWKKKMLWKPRWIKEWKSSNVLKPIWRKFWGPVIIREWVPIPKPPPQWQTTPVLPESTPETSGTVISSLTQPPTPNLSYLPKPVTFDGYSYDPPKRTYDRFKVSGSLSGSFGYQAPYLPVSNGFGSQAETYRGYSSYGSGADAHDLNPPVEAFNPLLSDYSLKPPTGNYIQNGHASSPGFLGPAPGSQPHTHPHSHYHHHHHHKVRFTPHTHNQDLTKFPPDWSSWKPLPPHFHRPSPSLAQASSAVSVVSATTSTTPRQDAAVTDRTPSPVSESAGDFIQQAPLVSEFHYSEPAPSTASTESPSTKPLMPSLPPAPEQEPSPRNPVRQSPVSPLRGPPPRPSIALPPRHQNAIPPQKYLKPSFSFPSDGSKPPPPFQLHKLPDFKALPTSSVATFHFVEGFPSNQTLTRAALIGNINRTASGNLAESSEVSILTPKHHEKKVAPHIVKLAQAVAEEHIKKTQNQKFNSSVTVQTTTDSVATEKTPVTVVLPTTSSSIRKTLKDYLNDEANAVQTTNIFIVTPVPQKTDEN